jgi:tetratricopeptide (TPR) repeat protein
MMTKGNKAGALMIVLLCGAVACSATRIERALRTADALRGEQKFEESEAAYKNIIQKFSGKPQLAQVYLSLGDLYFYNLNKNDVATAQYDMVLKEWPLSPEAAMAMQRLAVLYEKDDRFDRMIEMNENLVKYFPNHPDRFTFMHDIGAAYLKMKNYSQARLEFKKLLGAKDVPPSVLAATWYDMGETYFLERNESQALGYYKKMVELFPKSDLVPMAKLQMAQCYEELNDLQNAVVLEKELRQQYPDNDAIKAKLQHMEKRRREMNRGPQLLPWDRKAQQKGPR